jgi:hypothetical protein
MPQPQPPLKKFIVRFLQIKGRIEYTDSAPFGVTGQPQLSFADEPITLHASDSRNAQQQIFIEGGMWVQRDAKTRSWVPHTAIIEVYEVLEP